MKEAFLALTTTQRPDWHVPPLTKKLTKTPSNQSQKHILTHKLTHPLLTLTMLSALLWQYSHDPCNSAPSHTEITEWRAVKGVCALSLEGIKDAEGLKRIKAGAILPRLPDDSISLWAGLKFSARQKELGGSVCKALSWPMIDNRQNSANEMKSKKIYKICVLNHLNYGC